MIQYWLEMSGYSQTLTGSAFLIPMPTVKSWAKELLNSNQGGDEYQPTQNNSQNPC